MPPTTSERLQALGQSLHQLFVDLPTHDAITDTLDYLLGALYGLSRAHELNFRDRPGVHFSIYRGLLPDEALKIPQNQAPHGLWVAGFHFNSAIQRLASAFDRIPRMLGARMETTASSNGREVKKRRTTAQERMAEVNLDDHAQWALVYDEVNEFKHEPEGRAAGRGVSMVDALAAFEQTLALLAKAAPTLKARYK